MTQKHPSALDDRLTVSLGGEGRWTLLQELKAAQGFQGDWEPVTIGFEAIGAEAPWVFNGGEKVVTLTFDSRVPYRTLVGVLAQLWPELTQRGWVSRTRELNELSLALVRHVCLEHAHAGWQARLDTWNERLPDWKFKDRRGLISRFHRAEESLTGTRDGLKQFYATAGTDLVRATVAGGPEQMIDALIRGAEQRELGEPNA